jgi:phosphoribosyl 1,2-cyclic phosphate phosphodiesterase
VGNLAGDPSLPLPPISRNITGQAVLLGILDALWHQPQPTHFTLDQAVEVARRLAPKQTFFTHACHHLEHHATNATLPPGMELAYDGLILPLNGLPSPTASATPA